MEAVVLQMCVAVCPSLSPLSVLSLPPPVVLLHPDTALLAVHRGWVVEVTFMAERVGAEIANSVFRTAFPFISPDLSQKDMLGLMFGWICKAAPVANT